MISWSNPGWLWALSGLVIPLLIHLLNASSGKPVIFPAVRFAEVSNAQRVRRIALREPWLLALRLLLGALLVFWLAGMFWLPSASSGADSQVVVSPLALQQNAEAAKDQAAQLSSDPGLEPRQLAPGYPSLDDPALYQGPASDAIAEMATQWSGETTVLVADHPLDRRWRAPPPPASVSVRTLVVDSSAMTVGLSVAPERAEDGRIMRAALAALAARGDIRWQEITAGGDLEGSLDVWISLAEVSAKDDVANAPAHRLALRDAAADGEWTSVEINGEEFPVLRSARKIEGVSLLTDATGAPLAAISQNPQTQTGEPSVIQFAGRFEATTNALVSSGVFPDLLGEWLSLASLQPVDVAAARPAGPNVLLAALVLLLWLWERALALRSPGAMKLPTRNAGASR